MAVLGMRRYGDPILRQVAAPVAAVTPEIKTLIADMAETMWRQVGIGLAAPQVGVTKRLIVVDAAAKGQPPQPYRMANPEIVWASDEDNVYNEGCLSLPEHYADVVRPKAVRVRYLDHENEVRELAADGLLATCVQHEMDHLDGILFVDHISALKRNMILRKLLKAKRSGVFERDREHAL